MDPKEQVEQLQAALEGKEAQVTGLTERVKELGAFRQEALDAREAIGKHLGRIAELEAAVNAAQREAAAAKSALEGAAAKVSADEKKVAAALKIAEGVRAIL
jgi:chromosome segregation ATPase